MHPDATNPMPAAPFPRRPVHPAALTALTVWRLAVAGSAFYGFWLASEVMVDPWPGLSQQASLVAGAVFVLLAAYPFLLNLRRHEPTTPWLRGATTVLMLLVALTYMGLMGGDISERWSLFEHVITPALVVADYLLIGRNQANARWWHPWTWTLFPLAYLAYFYATEPVLYDFIQTDTEGYQANLAGFFAAVVVMGYLLYAYGMIKRAAPR